MTKTNRSWNLTLGSVRNVPIRVHGSFFLLLVWVFLATGPEESAFFNIAFLLSVFFCVLLHEGGHALVAQTYGVKTRDITLYPFGGIATLSSIPQAKEEFFIAWAGPVVSFMLAGLFWLGIDASGVHPLVVNLYRTNLVIAIFNLIPAIPMDGGRILRSVLEMLRVKSATTIAARISQFCSVILGLVGLYTGSLILMVIAFFVFMGAIQELMYSRTKHAIKNKTVRDLMVDRDKLFCFPHGTTLEEATRVALRSPQEVFPVVYNSELLGIVSRADLIETAALASEDQQYLSGIANREFLAVSAKTPLEVMLQAAQEADAEAVAVVEDGVFLGMVFPRTVADVAIVETFQKEHRAHAENER